MKIEDPATGNTWDSLYESVREFCNGTDCNGCPFQDSVIFCNEWRVCSDYPHQAVNMMGYREIHDEPRICDVLGVKVRQPFTIDSESGIFKVSENGDIFKDDSPLMDIGVLLYAIAHPDRIRVRRNWTEYDVECVKAIKTLCPDAVSVRRDNIYDSETNRYYDCLIVSVSASNKQSKLDGEMDWYLPDAEHKIIPSLRVDETVKLDEIGCI